MNNFEEKEIKEAQTLGDKLRQAREEEKLTLADAERAIQIRQEYLHYLEEGQYKKLPGEVYIKKFLTAYAGLLNLDIQRVLALFEEEKKIYQKISPLQIHPTNGKNLVKTHFFLNPHFLRNGLIVLIVLGLLIYLGIQINNIVAPPLLEIKNPAADNIITHDFSIEVSGVTEKEAKVTINGQEILGDQNGNFKTTVDLKEGINVLEISAVKKHSKEHIVYRRIRVEPPSARLNIWKLIIA